MNHGKKLKSLRINEGVRRITIGRYIKIAVFLYLTYTLCTGGIPFLRCKSVADEFTSSFSTSAFYGDAPCVDRVALVESPADGFNARIHILDEATERIDVSYYAMHMGETTDLFLGALLDPSFSILYLHPQA